MKIKSGSFAELLLLHNQIPELSPVANSDYFNTRIGNKSSLLLIGEVNEVAVAYKLGYWINSDCFYSWLGGVHPDYRKRGAAKSLLLEQERRVREMGAKEIRVKSMNQYQSMLLLLISQGYAITGVQLNAQGKEKILFSKKFV